MIGMRLYHLDRMGGWRGRVSGQTPLSFSYGTILLHCDGGTIHSVAVLWISVGGGDLSNVVVLA